MEPTSTTAKTPAGHRTHLDAAINETGRIIAAITPDQLHGPTPCDEFDVERLLGHLTMALQRTAAAGRGEAPDTWPTGPTPCPDGDWAALWSATADEAREGWADASKLERPTTLPWGTFPGAKALGVYTSEVVVHGWDLARATGQTPDFDDATVDGGFAAFRPQMPAEGRQQVLDGIAAMFPEGVEVDLPFALAKPVASDAPLLDQLVAWAGRDPAWQPA
jgi:uncharacterized protein (TIGR03086 family)